MKLSDWAKKQGISYKTAWRLYKQGHIKGYQLPTGTIIIEEEQRREHRKRCIIYARVSDHQSKDNLERQAERLKDYAMAKGYQIVDVVKEIGSGVNDRRAKLQKTLKRNDYDILLVEHKDRLTRFGFNYLQTLLEKCNIKIEVVNKVDDDKHDLIQDFISIIYSFSARIYGIRKGREKARKIKELITNE
jgi:predicted site-specific integrase-resolvase